MTGTERTSAFDATDSVDARVDRLRAGAAPDLYSPEAYIDWEYVETTLKRLQPGITILQHLIDAQPLERNALSEALSANRLVLDVARTILVAPSAVGFADGRELPQRPPRTRQELQRLADLLLDVGLGRILPLGSSVKDAVRLGTVALDTRKRGFRRRDLVDSEIRRLVAAAVRDLNDELDIKIAQLPARHQPKSLRGRSPYVLSIQGDPFAAIVTAIYNQSGGRQQRELSSSFPGLQRAADDHGILIIAIVDGRYITEAPRLVLTQLLNEVPYTMTVIQAKSGDLHQALVDALHRPRVRPSKDPDAQAIATLIAAELRAGNVVPAETLPVALDRAMLALSDYFARHDDQALSLGEHGSLLRWVDSSLVARGHVLVEDFEPSGAINLFCTLLHVKLRETPAVNDVVDALGAVPTDQVLPNTILIEARHSEPSADEFRQLAKEARRSSADATLAVLLIPARSRPAASTNLDLQRSLATSVVVLDAETLHNMSMARSPRSIFVREVLLQADLTKANPFNATGATSPRMFFGREEEEAALLSTIDTSSVALLGSRRIGKTSLLQRTVDTLTAEGWSAHYADCQSIGSWSEFASHVGPRWDVQLPGEFKPENLASLIDQLRRRTDARVAIVLDEIDYLLRWDQANPEGSVPEAMFRACRALSQEGAARFIFSGERLIAEKMWDPSSPHYNFCRPIYVQQLSAAASAELIQKPLEAMGITVEDPAGVNALMWHYTSGHPHLLQHLGEQLIRELNRRPAEERSALEPELIVPIADSVRYQTHYLETYWGQAAPLEKILTVLIAEGQRTHKSLHNVLEGLGIWVDASATTGALRMLELYGVLASTESPLAFRSTWFPDAIAVLGDTDVLLSNLKRGMDVK